MADAMPDPAAWTIKSVGFFMAMLDQRCLKAIG